MRILVIDDDTELSLLLKEFLQREGFQTEFAYDGAAGLEKGAVSAYLGAVPLFKDRELSKAAASILGDEAMHWAVLRQALGEEPVPAAFVS